MKNIYRTLPLVLLFLAGQGCTSLIPKGDRPDIAVIVTSVPPAGPTSNKGSVIAVDGSGCGFLGLLGNKEDAIYALKQKAFKAGANYVHITKTKEPYSDGKCRHNEYIIEGNAYKIIPLEDQKAGLILIRNGGFEDDQLGENGLAGSWHYGLQKWSGLKCGVLNARLGKAAFPKLAPEGENIAFLAYAGSYMKQVLEFRFVPGRHYQLNVVVGHRVESTFEDGDYRIELLAGNTILAHKQGKIPKHGEYADVKLQYISKPNDPHSGLPLKIVLRNLNTRQVNFDDVRLYNWNEGSGFVPPDKYSTSSATRESANVASTNDFEIIDNNYFKNISTNHRIQEYYGQPNSSNVINNSIRTGVAGFRIINNKWLFRSGFGKTSLLGTHPLNTKTPSMFEIKVNGNELRYSVRPHNSGNSLIEFWVKNSLIHSEVISEKKWHNRILKLPVNTTEVILKHHATGWRFEYLYWDILE